MILALHGVLLVLNLGAAVMLARIEPEEYDGYWWSLKLVNRASIMLVVVGLVQSWESL